MSQMAAHYFPDSYALGRKRFLDAAKAAGAQVESIQNPHANGPHGEPLYMDVARVGAKRGEAEHVMLTTSAVHGVEGFCGSGVQTGLLRAGFHEGLDTGTAFVLVHAVNPYGFAHLRRVNEDNIDLNRNVIDHGAPRPDDSAYSSVHGFISPPDLPARRDHYDALMKAYIDEHGPAALQAAVTGGQWSHADGIFYGGQAPAWSTENVRAEVERETESAARVTYIDLHTGLGPYGHGELMALSVGPGSVARARARFGEVTSFEDGDTVSAPVRGTVAELWSNVKDRAEVTAVVIEYGTRDLFTVLDALRLDNWLYLHGSVESAEGEAIKAKIRDALYPDEEAWKNMVFARAQEIFGKAVS